MRKTALGIGAFAGAGAIGSSTAVAQSEEDVLKTGAIYALGGPAAAAVAAYGYIVDGPDDSEVADSLEWQVHVDEFTRAREDELMLDQTLASLRRDVQLVENKAREEAIFRIYEQAVDSGDEADATAAAEEAINESFSTVQKGILDSWSIRYLRASTVWTTFDSSDQWDLDDMYSNVINIWNTRDDDKGGNSVGMNGLKGGTQSTSLYDGTSFEYNGVIEQDGDYYHIMDPVDYQSAYDSAGSAGKRVDTFRIKKPDTADYDSVDEDDALDIDDSNVDLINCWQWAEIYQDLDDEHTAVMDEVSSMVDTYFQDAQDGEIDLAEMVGPKHLSDTASTAKDFQESTMALRSMGFKIAEQSSVLSVDVDGEKSEYDGRLARTSDEPDPLPVGQEIDPELVPGSIYAAINVEDSDGNLTGEIAEITNTFEIVEAEGGASEVSFESRQLAESDTSSEDIEQIFKENFGANEDAKNNVYDTATGGGGAGGAGGFLDGDQDWGTIALGAGAAAIGWGYLTGGDD
ncbi:hypothetical protein DQW50_00430 [Halorubrum sp. 48-1-W]|uniref:hypothetical protein n=1 Tax=Halorubrum sp. 48-1-W TaxID=2249761 RepID=UPI000DCEBFA8|nr:hypothetical protein [Halorubrum sp. 48-1-W]RAW46894.1 hypothetical protein DQW50_00430 [Halorubrum sp. 48-1-W]